MSKKRLGKEAKCRNSRLFQAWMMQNKRFFGIPEGRGQNSLTLR